MKSSLFANMLLLFGLLLLVGGLALVGWGLYASGHISLPCVIGQHGCGPG